MISCPPDDDAKVYPQILLLTIKDKKKALMSLERKNFHRIEITFGYLPSHRTVLCLWISKTDRVNIQLLRYMLKAIENETLKNDQTTLNKGKNVPSIVTTYEWRIINLRGISITFSISGCRWWIGGYARRRDRKTKLNTRVYSHNKQTVVKGLKGSGRQLVIDSP